MRVRTALGVALVLALLAPGPGAAEDLDALGLENAVVDLLSPFFGDVGDTLQSFISIGKIGLGIVKFVSIVFDQVFNGTDVDMNFGSYIPLAERKILALFEPLSRRLDQLEQGIHGIGNSLRDLADGLPAMVRWEIALDTIDSYARPIDNLYKRFKLYQKTKDKIEDHTLMDFANNVVSHHPGSVMSLMAHLHSMVSPQSSTRSLFRGHVQTLSVLNNPKDLYHVSEKVSRKMNQNEGLVRGEDAQPESLSLRPGIFHILQEALKRNDVCQLHQSPQQLVQGLHIKLELTQARGFAMLQFAWMILRVFNEGNFTVEQEFSKELYLEYSRDLMREAKAALSKESPDFFRCDPREHREGDTFIQLTELLQGYIENEVDMSTTGSCSQNCRYYQHARSENCLAPETQYCGKHRRCRGTLHHCNFYHADATLCLSRNPYRRYEYIRYEDGTTLGQYGHCQSTDKMKVDSWWRFLYHCSYCMCLCDDFSSGTSDRYVSLTPALSNTQENMIVTGVKFTKQRRVIHIQIQEGQAIPQGQVNSSSLQWLPVEPISIISTAYSEGKHYKRLSFEDRSIDLDRLVGPKEHVVTGVRFRMLGSHLNLEVQITPINFTSGQLKASQSYWISSDNTPVMAQDPRQELPLYQPDVPTRFVASRSKIDSRPDTFVRFGPTDRRKDAAQLTVPFFDAQSVAPTPGSWFSGIELFHKGHPGSGGFLGLKVITYDSSQHMEEPEESPTIVTT